MASDVGSGSLLKRGGARKAQQPGGAALGVSHSQADQWPGEAGLHGARGRQAHEGHLRRRQVPSRHGGGAQA